MKTSILERVLGFLSIKKNSVVSSNIKNITKPKKGASSSSRKRTKKMELYIKPSQRNKNLYTNTLMDYELSRTKVENFIQCPRCFYLDRKLGVNRPNMPRFTLNLAVDSLLKNEFNIYRERQIPHPLCVDSKIDLIPYLNSNLNDWRNNFIGIRHTMPNINITVFGSIDDIWINPATQELFLVDYKATVKSNGINFDNDPYSMSYKRQAEMYQWLFRQNGFKVSNTFYFVYSNGYSKLARFDRTLQFDISIIEYQGDDSWVESTIQDAYQCLQSDSIPPFTASCEYCQYLQTMNKHTSV